VQLAQRGATNGEAGRGGESRPPHTRQLPGSTHQFIQTLHARGLIGGVEHERVLAIQRELLPAADPRNRGHAAARHGFQGSPPERLVVREVDENVTLAQELRDLRAAHSAVILEAEISFQRHKSRLVALAAEQVNLDLFSVASRKLPEHAHGACRAAPRRLRPNHSNDVQ
jgi:hypothetical protein